MKDFTKFVLCALSGTIFGLLYKFNREKINKNQIELDILKNQKSVNVSQLKDSFSITDDNQLSLFVEGQVGQNQELLKSTNSKHVGVLIKKSKYEIETIENNGTSAQQRRLVSATIDSASSFILQSQQNSKENLLIKNFQETIILPKVLKHQKTDQFLIPPEVRTNMREPKTKSRIQGGKNQKVYNNYFKNWRTFMCVYGNVIFDRTYNTFRITAPKFFAISKEQIIGYFEADQNTLKFLQILMAIGGITFSIFALKYLYKTLFTNEKKQKFEVQIKTIE
ncbi:unnamed protein product (macronuclear) [Paramecium tetraurelia]|uniref:Transmembrane protein n=1 Tax=Paramecium tetraurelia TaxID=5888 RepID=A0D4E0_PARTE|nr:uncharacterized protein GSPATT00013373001 [Paramecium tetraurelia]CAK77907.1 unnamed protein product [Paramecium tetraurelia]|eukprot:XP_001445304.1 hypothetical protein (macronuclear) [Paramecium tetraurelia strain d4-2]